MPVGIPRQKRLAASAIDAPGHDRVSLKIKNVRRSKPWAVRSWWCQPIWPARNKCRHCRAVEQQWGTINGVIHAAGIVGDQAFTPLKDMGKPEVHMHFKPKVYGLPGIGGII